MPEIRGRRRNVGYVPYGNVESTRVRVGNETPQIKDFVVAGVLARNDLESVGAKGSPGEHHRRDGAPARRREGPDVPHGNAGSKYGPLRGATPD